MSSDHNNIADNTAAQLEHDSRTGFQGSLIPTHRAITHFDFPRQRLKSVLLLPLLFTLLAWPAIQLIDYGWSKFYLFWLENLHLSGQLSSTPYGPGWLHLSLPYLDIAAAPLQNSIWWNCASVVTIMLAASWFVPNKLLPLRYLLRVIAFIQITALLFFFFIPERFPYSLADHLEAFQATCVSLMVILPWVHALIYYIFDFSLFKKLFFTLVSLLCCSLLTPFTMLMHAYVVHNWSLLQLPLLYFVFGLFMLIMVCIALYGWAMSWQDNQGT